MNGRIAVVGSINVDLVVRVEHLPRAGETVLGGRFEQHFGGKGANQAVAAVRAGASVALIGAVGDDEHGAASLAALRAEGIDVSRVRTVDAPTGVALIVVGANGDNQIALAPGANSLVTAADANFDDLRPSVVLTSFEIPVEVAVAACRVARGMGATPIVTPAPARPLSADLLAARPILVPNQHELVASIGDGDPRAALDEMAARAGAPVIVTQGAAGALLAHGPRRTHFAAPHPASVVDTTGAGDAFVGALAAWLAAGSSLDAAITAGNAAGALSVTRAGARDGMPYRDAISAQLAS